VRTYILAVTGPTRVRTADIIANGLLPGGAGSMAGSNLRPTNVNSNVDEGSIDLRNYPLTGSWKLMGGITDQDSVYGRDGCSLWLRIF
jgi:hypothetical protein